MKYLLAAALLLSPMIARAEEPSVQNIYCTNCGDVSTQLKAISGVLSGNLNGNAQISVAFSSISLLGSATDSLRVRVDNLDKSTDTIFRTNFSTNFLTYIATGTAYGLQLSTLSVSSATTSNLSVLTGTITVGGQKYIFPSTSPVAGQIAHIENTGNNVSNLIWGGDSGGGGVNVPLPLPGGATNYVQNVATGTNYVMLSSTMNIYSIVASSIVISNSSLGLGATAFFIAGGTSGFRAGGALYVRSGNETGFNNDYNVIGGSPTVFEANGTFLGSNGQQKASQGKVVIGGGGPGDTGAAVGPILYMTMTTGCAVIDAVNVGDANLPVCFANNTGNGGVGIRTLSPTTSLSVYGAATAFDVSVNDDGTVAIFKVNATQANISGADTFASYRSATGEEGAVTGSAGAGILVYNTFSATHKTLVDPFPGGVQPYMLLEGTGEVIGDWHAKKICELDHHATRGDVAKGLAESTDTIKECTHPECEKVGPSPKSQLTRTRVCTTRKSKAAWGFYAGEDRYGRSDNLSIGMGFAYVVNCGKNLTVGDLLMSTDVQPGAVELQDDDVMHTYTVGETIENIIWNPGETSRKVAIICHGG